MKNIHLIPTDKPSRLHKFGDCFDTNAHLQKWHNDAKPEYYNIYITSDEEIKGGDWCYYLNSLGGGNIVCQAYKHSGDKRMLFDNGRHNRKIGEGITPLIGECKKIILTTDPTLIADGVQPIDDDFLEWFVKNPTCEEVDVTRGYLGMGGFVETNEPLSKDKMEYKIIIPIQEHPKQIKCYCGHTTYCDCSPLEEQSNEIQNYLEKTNEPKYSHKQMQMCWIQSKEFYQYRSDIGFDSFIKTLNK